MPFLNEKLTPVNKCLIFVLLWLFYHRESLAGSLWIATNVNVRNPELVCYNLTIFGVWNHDA